MASEKEIIITFLYNRSGKSKLNFNELYLTLSMQLNWFTPNDAKTFIAQALDEKLLKKEKEEITPNFDYKKIVVPLNYSPSKNVFTKETKVEKKQEKELIDKIIEVLKNKTKLDEKTISQKINEFEKKRNISTEVAALLVGKEYNVSLEDYFEKIKNKIFSD